MLLLKALIATIVLLCVCILLISASYSLYQDIQLRKKDLYYEKDNEKLKEKLSALSCEVYELRMKQADNPTE